MNTFRAHEFIMITWEWFKMALAEPMIAVSTIFAYNKTLIMLILLLFAILVFAFLFDKVFLDTALSFALTGIIYMLRRRILNFRLLSSCSSVNWAFLHNFLSNNFEWTWISGSSWSIIISMSKLSSCSLLRGQGYLHGLDTLNLKRGILFTR